MVVQWWGVAPFALLLACIAFLPLIPATAAAWERHRTKLGVVTHDVGDARLEA